MPVRPFALLFLLAVACAAEPASSPVERTRHERTARFRLTVEVAGSRAASTGVLLLDGSRAVADVPAGLAGPPRRHDGPGIDLADLVAGASTVDTDHAGRIVRVVRREPARSGPDVVVTLELGPFGVPVPSPSSGT